MSSCGSCCNFFLSLTSFKPKFPSPFPLPRDVFPLLVHFVQIPIFFLVICLFCFISRRFLISTFYHFPLPPFTTLCSRSVLPTRSRYPTQPCYAIHPLVFVLLFCDCFAIVLSRLILSCLILSFPYSAGSKLVNSPLGLFRHISKAQRLVVPFADEYSPNGISPHLSSLQALIFFQVFFGAVLVLLCPCFVLCRFILFKLTSIKRCQGNILGLCIVRQNFSLSLCNS